MLVIKFVSTGVVLFIKVWRVNGIEIIDLVVKITSGIVRHIYRKAFDFSHSLIDRELLPFPKNRSGK